MLQSDGLQHYEVCATRSKERVVYTLCHGTSPLPIHLCGLVRPILCSTSWAQDYVVHHRPAPCTTNLSCLCHTAPINPSFGMTMIKILKDTFWRHATPYKTQPNYYELMGSIGLPLYLLNLPACNVINKLPNLEEAIVKVHWFNQDIKLQKDGYIHYTCCKEHARHTRESQCKSMIRAILATAEL